VVTTSSAASDVDIGGVQSVPRATTAFRMGLNLNSSASAGATFSNSFDVYNTLGERVTLTYNFLASSGAQTWAYTVTSSAGTVSGGATGTIQFDAQGAIILPATDQTVTITGFASGAADLAMTWDILDNASAAYNDITGYSAQSSVVSMVQDGYSTGTLRGLSVDSSGLISGLFSNGQTQDLFQLALADFASPWGLQRTGGSLYAETTQSGQALTGTAGSGGLGTILGGSLELSNVDLASEFVSMIQNQRGYQANSRVITTVDDMLIEAVNLKR